MPQFNFELQCTMEDQPPPKRPRICMHPGLLESVLMCDIVSSMYAESVEVTRGYSSEAPKPQLTGDDGLGGCPHCLCDPCVISLPPDFLVGRGSPHLRNVEKRYTLYRKFWRMFTDMKLWGHPVYLRRKQAITSLLDQREILPKCVVKVKCYVKLLISHCINVMKFQDIRERSVLQPTRCTVCRLRTYIRT